jgi:hypothetical protein
MTHLHLAAMKAFASFVAAIYTAKIVSDSYPLASKLEHLCFPLSE